MRKIYNISTEQATPSIESVLGGQGIPRSLKPDERTVKLAGEAISSFRQIAKPVGILMEISKNDFESISIGEGRNEIDSPINPIYLSSDCLALFAVTVGEEICSEISERFNKNDFALGSMLDSAASEGTEMTAQTIEDFYRQHLIETGKFNIDSGILRFSPGYCGWHISAQQKLFQALHPEDIRITLNDSFLMQPLKSISGVIIFGRKKIFDFDDNFSFCIDCKTHTCRNRVQAVNKH
jgi:hypothetical protein